MSDAGLSLDPAGSAPAGRPRSRLTGLLQGARRLLEGAAFWSAIVLPLLYLPLLAVAGVEAAAYVLPVHVAALVVGHGHR